jgi:FixJ family two-component response regulator
MPQEMNERSIVHIVDDDESFRRVLDSLCRSVGLKTRTYGSAQEFLNAEQGDLADVWCSMSACPVSAGSISSRN